MQFLPPPPPHTHTHICICICTSCPKPLRIQLFVRELEFKSKGLKSVTFNFVENTSFNIFFQIFMHFLTCNIQHTPLLRVISALSCWRRALFRNMQYANRWIGRGRGCVQNWPARSPDLTRMYFHLLKHTENMHKVKTDMRVEQMEPYCMIKGARTIQ